MNLDRVDSGRDVPRDINVIVEIPLRGDPVKYEVDKATGAMFVDRFMNTAIYYPCMAISRIPWRKTGIRWTCSSLRRWR